MPVFDKLLYDPSVLTFDADTVRLNPDYRVRSNAVVTFSDDDNQLNGDLYVDAIGDDANQYASVTFADGTTAGGPTTQIYSEEQYTLTAPGQTTITLARIEINDELIGYLPTTPLVKGVDYSVTTTNTTPRTARTYPEFVGAICLSADTFIETAEGSRRIGEIRPGDLVRTRDHGLQPVRWAGTRRYDASDLRSNPKLRPIRIAAGALGSNLPQRDLAVSRQHRMVVASTLAADMFGAAEVLVSAIRLVGRPGIEIDETAEGVSFCHLLFDRHQVIFAEGAPTESLFTGPEAMRAVPAEAREELLAIFPELRDKDFKTDPALLIPDNAAQKALIARHAQHGTPLLETV